MVAAVAIPACSRGAAPALPPVDLPDLSRMAPPVQVQIRQAFDALQHVKADPRKVDADGDSIR